ncbi:hypothetical protein Igag_0773 [Ignisphaera aggregans DSM 17230]|uniref:Uncharacterized protein n=1 Tax=Ignisphaera aggregans (strain DSM 17230 / JCM 13409 / AQ1.S1) TaxID=583356 RepID=E0STC3_IGNAA|nr:hypothetical protein Igag_0773 [Ignisphaera aggregans DSM 17230]
MTKSILEEIEETRKKNLISIIEYARWEAEMVRGLGVKWFEMRDRWLIEAFERVREMWRDHKIRETEIKAILAKDRVKYMRLKRMEKEQ